MAKGTERGALYQDMAASHPAAGTSSRFGHVLLSGGTPGMAGLFLSVDFDTFTPARPSGDQWLWSNSIGGRISRSAVDGVARQEWLLGFTHRLAAQTEIVWGAVPAVHVRKPHRVHMRRRWNRPSHQAWPSPQRAAQAEREGWELPGSYGASTSAGSS